MLLLGIGYRGLGVFEWRVFYRVSVVFYRVLLNEFIIRIHYINALTATTTHCNISLDNLSLTIP